MPRGLIVSSSLGRFFSLNLGDLLADLIHVEVLDLRNQVLERGQRQRTRLTEHDDTVGIEVI